MISYAQNCEDVMLRRALVDREIGFYVDVGAADPVKNSVTHHFYERGWSGINVEPEPRFFSALASVRTRDVNLGVAVASESGETELVVVGIERELSTSDPAVAAKFYEAFETSRVSVGARRLDEILEEHPARQIDFIKIDVEGAERDVLASFDLARSSPTVLVVESTWPGTPESSHQLWEPDVLDAGYELGLFDGLNRFYARANDEETLSALRVPANVFDNFIQYRWWSLLSAEAKAELVAAGFPNPDL